MTQTPPTRPISQHYHIGNQILTGVFTGTNHIQTGSTQISGVRMCTSLGAIRLPTTVVCESLAGEEINIYKFRIFRAQWFFLIIGKYLLKGQKIKFTFILIDAKNLCETVFDNIN